MRRRNPYVLAIESFRPTKRHWLLGSPYAKRTRSPFLELKDFPDAEEVISLLRENEDIEVEFDTIGREMKIFEVWNEYRGLWFDALKAAVEMREREDAGSPAPPPA